MRPKISKRALILVWNSQRKIVNWIFFGMVWYVTTCTFTKPPIDHVLILWMYKWLRCGTYQFQLLSPARIIPHHAEMSKWSRDYLSLRSTPYLPIASRPGPGREEGDLVGRALVHCRCMPPRPRRSSQRTPTAATRRQGKGRQHAGQGSDLDRLLS